MSQRASGCERKERDLYESGMGDRGAHAASTR